MSFEVEAEILSVRGGMVKKPGTRLTSVPKT